MAAQLAISSRFFKMLAKLEPEDQARATKFVMELERDSRSHGLRLKPISGAKSKGIYSARVNDDFRVVLHQDGNTWALLHIAHHDPAYKWGENCKVGRHPVTGSLQVIETVETVREVERVVTKSTVSEEKPLFEKHEDDYLISLGVPKDWLSVIKEIRNDDQLLTVCMELPEDVAERLMTLAGGKLVTPPKPLATNQPVLDSADTTRRFYIARDEDELRRVLSAPLQMWLGFLHPSQKSIVEAEHRGPVKVTGSAGTGKTVVAMHRARHLARQDQDVLLTTYVTTLCENIERNLELLCNKKERTRITVSTIHGQALRLVRKVESHVKPASETDIRPLIERLAGEYTPDFDFGFLWAEWQNVIQLHGIGSWAEYRTARRTGRGRPLSVRERKTLWKVFGGAQDRLANRGRYDWPGLCRRATELLEKGLIKSPFDAVIVDELQDLKPPALRLIQALSKDAPGQLMLVGDAGQRIYPGGFSLKSLGIEVRGRSHILRLNYRTTEQIRRAADRMLGLESDDMDGGSERRDETRSLLEGPEPELHGFANRKTEEAAIIERVKAWLGEGIRHEAIGIFTRTNRRINSLKKALENADILCGLLSDNEFSTTGKVQLGTMHCAKGLEFKSVIIAGCSSEELPNEYSLKGVNDPLDRENAVEQEKRLLYVAMTRARDDLFVSWTGKPSTFLNPLMNREENNS